MNNPIRNVTLTRQPSTPEGTFGDWLSDSGFICKTVEKPWMDNETDQSCVPVGKYIVEWDWSDKHQCNVYHLRDVPNRVAVEIHSANLQVQLQGCIAPGASIAMFTKDVIALGVPEVDCRGVTDSKNTIAALEKDMRDKDGNQASFWLEIKGV